LSQYNYKIKHYKGTENSQADTLSRQPNYKDKTRQPQPAILRKNNNGMLGNNPMILAATITLSRDMLNTIKEAMKDDQLMQQILATTPGALEKDRVLHIKGLVYVPLSLIQQTIRDHHDAPVHGHFSINRTCKHIGQNYYFPNIRKKVEKYIRDCETCLRDKPKRHAPYRKLQNPEIPQQPWEWIMVNFVGPLPTTKQQHDYLAVISDRLTKYIHLKATTTTITAREMATIFTNTIIMNHGVPKYITLDRDKLFTSKFWKSVTNTLGIELQITTAYRPQSNGQTKRVNQMIEQYLRYYVNYVQDDWEEQLPMAQFTYNNSTHSATGITPFKANYRYHPSLHGEPIQNEPIAEEANLFMEKLKTIQTQLTQDLEFVNLKMGIYYDKH
jgi:hypothetical protein